MKTLRLFELLDRLRRARQPISAATLAREFAVSERTIYRDMVALQAIGAPVVGEAGLGYQLEDGFFLPPLRFDADELDAIRLGLQLAKARGDAALNTAADRAIAKIAAVLAGGEGDAFQDAPWRAVSKAAPPAPLASDLLVRLRQAIRQRTVIALSYIDLKDQLSDRVARPLGLTVFDGTWLLTIWCETRGDFRNLRVERITALTPLDRRFRPERGKRFEDYLKTLELTDEARPTQALS
jgi:predicted DNA-binding transcriptional regulator YafY